MSETDRGWLARQADRAKEDIETLPMWLRGKASLPMSEIPLSERLLAYAVVVEPLWDADAVADLRNAAQVCKAAEDLTRVAADWPDVPVLVASAIDALVTAVLTGGTPR